MANQTEANVAIVKHAYAVLESGPDWKAFAELLTDDCELHEAPSMPYGGTYIGKEGFMAGTMAVFTAFDNFHFHVLNYLTGDDLVVVHLVLTGMGRKTGKTFSMPLMEKWRIRDGKVAEIRPFYFDVARISECFEG